MKVMSRTGRGEAALSAPLASSRLLFQVAHVPWLMPELSCKHYCEAILHFQEHLCVNSTWTHHMQVVSRAGRGEAAFSAPPSLWHHRVCFSRSLISSCTCPSRAEVRFKHRCRANLHFCALLCVNFTWQHTMQVNAFTGRR